MSKEKSQAMARVKLGKNRSIGYTISDHKGRTEKRGLEVKSETPHTYHLAKTTKRGRAVFRGVSHETE